MIVSKAVADASKHITAGSRPKPAQHAGKNAATPHTNRASSKHTGHTGTGTRQAANGKDLLGASKSHPATGLAAVRRQAHRAGQAATQTAVHAGAADQAKASGTTTAVQTNERESRTSLQQAQRQLTSAQKDEKGLHGAKLTQAKTIVGDARVSVRQARTTLQHDGVALPQAHGLGAVRSDARIAEQGATRTAEQTGSARQAQTLGDAAAAQSHQQSGQQSLSNAQGYLTKARAAEHGLHGARLTQAKAAVNEAGESVQDADTDLSQDGVATTPPDPSASTPTDPSTPAPTEPPAPVPTEPPTTTSPTQPLDTRLQQAIAWLTAGAQS